jgi:acetyltransferase
MEKKWNLEKIFSPKSIAIFGVSNNPGNLAVNILNNLKAFGYKGNIYAIGRQYGSYMDIPIYTSLDELPTPVDQAVFLTPARTIPDLLEDCAKRGIPAFTVESSGFSEYSDEGRQLEERIIQITNRYGTPMVGPNGIALMNMEIGLCLPFVALATGTVHKGKVSIVTQSGGVFTTLLDRLSLSGIGVNKLVSIGNKTVLNENDYLAYLMEDEGTSIILLYLESISDGRTLVDLIQKSTKPVIVIKSNRGQASANIAKSHTSALASDDAIVSAALRQAGAIRANGFRDATAIAQALSLPPVKNRDLIIISRSGGHAIISADASERNNFKLIDLPEKFRETLASHAPAKVVQLTNPVDLGAAFNVDFFEYALKESLLLKPASILLIHTNLNEKDESMSIDLSKRIANIARQSDIPIAYCLFPQGSDTNTIQKHIDIPIFTEVEEALSALSASCEHYQRKESSKVRNPESNKKITDAATLQLLNRRTLLTVDEALTVCKSYGFPVIDWRTVSTVQEAIEVGKQLGFPLAMKLVSREITHKMDVGGVRLNLRDPESVGLAAKELLAIDPGNSFLMLQPMLNGFSEVILGAKKDANFGSVIMFGLGGTWVEVLKDISFRVAPITRTDAEDMLNEIRGHKILEGVRGQPPLNKEIIIHSLLALSQLMVENPQINEMDINPFMVSSSTGMVVDARINITG